MGCVIHGAGIARKFSSVRHIDGVLYWSTVGSVISMLSIRLQKGQLMFSQPHCSVELLGALSTFTVMGPVCWSLVANCVFSSRCPDRMMLASAPSDSMIAPEGRTAAAPDA